MFTKLSIKLVGLVLAGTLLHGAPAAAGTDPSPQDPRLRVAMKLDLPSAGVSVAPDGRKFLVIVRLDGSADPRVVEWQDDKTVPYPSGQRNALKRGDDPAKGLVRVNAQRIGPDGKLWLVDVGAPGIGDEVLPGGAKLVRVDLSSNTVDRVYPLAAAVKPKSYVDDVRFNGPHAYLTDAGVPGLIVLDLDTGALRRVLDGDASTTGQAPVKGWSNAYRTKHMKECSDVPGPGVEPGQFVAVRGRSSRTVHFAIVGDLGPNNKLGEASVGLLMVAARRTEAPTYVTATNRLDGLETFDVVVFKGTAYGKPLNLSHVGDMERASGAVFRQWAGSEQASTARLIACGH